MGINGHWILRGAFVSLMTKMLQLYKGVADQGIDTYCWVMLSWSLWFRSVSQQWILQWAQCSLDGQGQAISTCTAQLTGSTAPLRSKMGRGDSTSPGVVRTRGKECLGFCFRKSLSQDESRGWKEAHPRPSHVTIPYFLHPSLNPPSLFCLSTLSTSWNVNSSKKIYWAQCTELCPHPPIHAQNSCLSSNAEMMIFGDEPLGGS